MNAVSRGKAGVVSLLILTGLLAVAGLRAEAQTFDLSNDFGFPNNPSGPWSYGWSTAVGGPITLFTFNKVSPTGNGVPLEIWQLSNLQLPGVYQNGTTNTATDNGGQGVYPPDAVLFFPGDVGLIQNYGVIRFTVPSPGGGTYQVGTLVHSYLNGSVSGDCDFHVVRNGTELFGVFLPGNGGTNYTNNLTLATGDTIDFVVGRGADGNNYGSGLNIKAAINLIDTNPVAPTILSQPQSQTVSLGTSVTFTVVADGTAPLGYQWRKDGNNIAGATGPTLALSDVQFSDAGACSVVVSNIAGSITSADAVLTVNPVPPPPTSFDVSRDFGFPNNPSGAWSYGWTETVGGDLTKFTFNKTSPTGNGVPLEIWQLSNLQLPGVYQNGTTNTATDNGGQGVYPPDTVLFFPGDVGLPQNYGVIRFTVPGQGDGTYQVGTLVRAYLNGPLSGDCDFHVVRNGTELFGAFLPGNGGTNYTNNLTLTAGDTIDFVVGRGADGNNYGSGLNIKAAINLIDTNPVAPTILSQPQSQTVSLGTSVTFSVLADGTAPLSYQWRKDGNNIAGATGPTLALSDVQFSDAGACSVVVSNIAGSITSADAVLTVNPVPPPPTSFDVSRDFEYPNNPAGAWTYGFASGVGGDFTKFTFSKVAPAPNGVPMEVWCLDNLHLPGVYHNDTTNTAIGNGGQEVDPPGSVLFFPGDVGLPQNYGVIRFTVPGQGGGTYQVGTLVRAYLNGPLSGDCDFHVVRNGTELFGAFLPGNGGTNYTNNLTLAAGDTIDFVVGRGADGNNYASGLNIKAAIDLIDTNPVAPMILTQPQSQTVTAGTGVKFSVAADGTAPLSYQWRLNGAELNGATGDSLVLSNVQPVDSGAYSVVVTNVQGSATSDDAVLTVNPVPPPPTSFDVSRDFGFPNNPSGPWSYGWAATVGGDLTKFTFNKTSPTGNGVPLEIWQLSNLQLPGVYQNGTTYTATDNGGQGVYPPGAVLFFPGDVGLPQNYGVIRFTVPGQGDGTYQVGTLVRAYLNGPLSGDCDFHVVRNGSELFGAFLPGNGGTNYTNNLTLAAGDTIDFVVGRGADGNNYGSGLNIKAAINLIDTNPVAPVILAQPQSQTVTAGTGVKFSVAADGTAPLSYQWRLNGAELNGATGDSLVLSNVQPVDSGAYSVVVTNVQGSATSDGAVLTVNPVPPPPTSFDVSRDFGFPHNPSGAWSYGWAATVGGDLTKFTFNKMSPTGNGVPLEIWQLSNLQLPGVYQNGTTNTATDNGGQGVYPPGTVLFFPGDVGLPQNYGVIRFTVPGQGDGTYQVGTLVRAYLNGPLSGDCDFHMVRNGTELFGAFLPGNGGTNYTNNLTLAAGDAIDFVVGRGTDGNNYGSGLNIKAAINLIDTNPVAPTILTQPQSQTVTAGTSVKFSVAADGTAPLSYQWRLNGAGLNGATGGSLVLSNVQPGDSGAYSVVAANLQGSVISADAVLTVNPLPRQKTYDLARDFSAENNPAGAWSYGYETSLGGAFTLWTAAYRAYDPAGVPIEIWAINGSGPSQLNHNGSSRTANSDGGQGVYPPGSTWFYPGHEGNSDNYGAIRFTVQAVTAGTYRLESAVHSYLDGPLSGDTDFHVVKNGKELFEQFLPGSSGTGYTNTLTLGDRDTIDFLVGRGLDNHLYGSGLKIQATLDLVDTNPAAPAILLQPQSRMAAIGASVTFDVSADGTAPLSYQWSFNGSSIDGATGNSLTLNNVQPTDAGNYSVTISNAISSVTSADAVLTVTSTGTPPAITSEPAGDNVEIGASATFTVSASGSEPLGYQWYFDGTAVSGATNNSLTIASVQAGDAGTYWVVVSNPFGSVRSMGAVLYISSGGGGSVNFSNLGESHVYDVDGTTRLPAGTTFLAQLYAGPSADSLQAVAGTASFVFPGLFDGGTRYIPSVAPGQVASVQVRVWETAYGTTYEQARATGGRTGTSAILQVRTGGGGIPPTIPAELVGLQSFSLVPGLAPRALVFVGRSPLAFLTAIRKIPSGQFQFTLSGDAGAVYTIEASTDLVNWTQITNVVNSSGAVPIVDPDAANRSHRFYRARPTGQ